MPEPSKYRPSNSGEGMWFESMFCDQCVYEDGCEVMLMACFFDKAEPEYPEELQLVMGNPTCTKFSRIHKKGLDASNPLLNVMDTMPETQLIEGNLYCTKFSHTDEKGLDADNPLL